jgi:signal peptidase I
MKFENLFWWQYKPSDEREQELYRKAYSRAYKTLTVLLVCGAVFLSAYPFDVDPKLLFFAVIAVLGIAYVAGWTVVKGEELTLQKTNPVRQVTQVFFTKNQTLKGVIGAIGSLYGTYILVVLYWPEMVVPVTVGVMLLIRVLLSVGAYGVTKQFEPTVRWLMVIFIPLTAIFFAHMKKRTVIGFIGSVLVSVVMYTAVLSLPLMVARTYIVTPFTITTDTFAPELPKGAYRFVDKREKASIVVNDYVIIKVDKWYVMQVQAIAGDIYTVKNETLGERQVSRSEIIGRVINEESWFTAFIQTQMPKE